MRRKKGAFDALRRTKPLREDDVPGPDSPEATELLARILETPRSTQEERTLQRRNLRLVLAIAAVSLVAVAATWIWVRTISIPNAILCYQAVDLDADTAAAPPSEQASAEACVGVWEQQILVNPELASPGSAPPLTGCVAENGALVVFPSDDPMVCDQLGLARPDPAGQEDADQIRQLEQELVEYFQSNECVPITDAQQRVSEFLAAHRLTSWVTERTEGSPDRPCASFSIDPELEIIFIIPIPRQ
jgi:hypothetical protein